MNLITWENASKDLYFGYTAYDLENEYLCTYAIDCCTLACSCSKDGIYHSLPAIRFASLEDAKQVAELIERGRVLD